MQCIKHHFTGKFKIIIRTTNGCTKWVFLDLTVYLGMAALTLILLAMYRRFTLFRRCGIPGPTPWPIVGNLVQQLLGGLEETQKKWDKQYGDIYGVYNGYRPTVVIRDPELIKRVMVKDFTNFMDRPIPRSLPKLFRDSLFFMEGSKWKNTRNILTPTFSAGKLRLFVPVTNECAETLAKHVSDRAGEVVEVKKFIKHFTMDVIAKTAFGIDIDSQNQPDDPFVSSLDPIFNFTLKRKLLMICSMSIPKFDYIISSLGLHVWPRKSVDFYQKAGQMLINEKRQGKSFGRIDFIKMLVDAEFDNSKQELIHDGVDTRSVSDYGLQKETIERLSDDEINGQAFVFFLAGYDTTASALRFAAYALALYPDIDEKLHDEIVEQLGEDIPTYDNLNKLKYMDMFLDEVLRFYSPVGRLVRSVKEDIVHGNMRIPKGCTVSIPVNILQHNPEYYPDPETFDPSRFSTKNKNFNVNNGFTYLPFGAGPRHCIGMRLALMEIKIALVNLLRKVKFCRCEETQVPLELVLHLNLIIPKNPVKIRVEMR